MCGCDKKKMAKDTSAKSNSKPKKAAKKTGKPTR